jgi:hypothetical protein
MKKKVLFWFVVVLIICSGSTVISLLNHHFFDGLMWTNIIGASIWGVICGLILGRILKNQE